MGLTAEKVFTGTLTYEQYMAEEEVNCRYDILDGLRVLMSNPTRRHQTVAGNIYDNFRDYQVTSRRAKAFFAPCDVLITRVPLRTRQPDVLFISNAQLARCGVDTDPTAMEAAPELVVEILSPSEKPGVRRSKIGDYCSIGVKECWIVSLDAGTVEVLRLTPDDSELLGTWHMGQTLRSSFFPDLTMKVDDVFAP